MEKRQIIFRKIWLVMCVTMLIFITYVMIFRGFDNKSDIFIPSAAVLLPGGLQLFPISQQGFKSEFTFKVYRILGIIFMALGIVMVVGFFITLR